MPLQVAAKGMEYLHDTHVHPLLLAGPLAQRGGGGAEQLAQRPRPIEGQHASKMRWHCEDQVMVGHSRRSFEHAVGQAVGGVFAAGGTEARLAGVGHDFDPHALRALVEMTAKGQGGDRRAAYAPSRTPPDGPAPEWCERTRPNAARTTQRSGNGSPCLPTASRQEDTSYLEHQPYPAFSRCPTSSRTQLPSLKVRARQRAKFTYSREGPRGLIQLCKAARGLGRTCLSH